MVKRKPRKWKSGWSGIRWSLPVILAGLLAPAASFGSMIEISGHDPHRKLAFKEGALELPLMVNVQFNPSALRDGLNHLALGYGGRMYHPGESFGIFFGIVAFPVDMPRFDFEPRRRGRDHSPSWVGQHRLLSLNSGYPTTPYAGIGSFRDLSSFKIAQFTLSGTTGVQPTTVEVTLRGTVTAPQIATTPLPAGIWLFASGLGFLGLMKRRMGKRRME